MKPEVEGMPFEMELDTGAAVSLISTETYNRILKHLPLCSTDIVLRTYTGQALRPEGVIDVHVKMGKQTAVLPLYDVGSGLQSVIGVRKFHQYLYGRKFTLFTDHRPLTTIFGPQNGIPSMAAARMQRWALLLSAHNYTIEYKRAEHLPLQVEHQEKRDAVELFYLGQVEKLPVSATDIRHETMSDSTLSTVVEMVLKGTQAVSLTNNDELSPLISKHNELSVHNPVLNAGYESRCSQQAAEKSAGGAAHWPLRNCPNESHCSQLCVVAGS